MNKKIKEAFSKDKLITFVSSTKGMISLALIINLIIETFSRRSVVRSLGHMISSPLNYINGALIIFLTLSVSGLFKKKGFVLGLISTIWVGLAVANFILLGFRTTPLAAIDFQILKSVLGIVNVYLSIAQIIMIVIALAFVIAALVMSWIKLPKKKVHYKSAIISIILSFSLIVIPSFSLGEEKSSRHFGNLIDAYEQYGFAYCFSSSIFDKGIKAPENYSAEVVAEILEELKEEENKFNLRPNIVLVQLESFFDVNYLKDIQYSKNPVPNFSHLKDNYTSGKLTVPSIGAGTANTEFEILTGMNIEFFGAGEYPYKTILKDTTTESLAYNLANLGYYTHAIHNHTGSFYDRNEVYDYLGFDSYSSLEYMYDVEYTELGWAKDNILTEEIIKALDASEEQDFIFAVSVQAHGRYPNIPLTEVGEVEVYGFIEEENQFSLDYFVEQVFEVDKFIGELILAVKAYPEPTVLVFYGDHLPSLGIFNENLEVTNRFQTEYVIWSNYFMEERDKDLEAYQLSSYLFEQLNMDEGLLSKFHQKNSQDNTDYQEELKILQYDMLYGEKYVYEGNTPHHAKGLEMGIDPILITGVEIKNNQTVIIGENFNEWSVVYLDDDNQDTIFVDRNTLIIEEIIDDNHQIFIAQQSKKGDILSQTSVWNFSYDK